VNWYEVAAHFVEDIDRDAVEADAREGGCEPTDDE
jgi:hypothetical protein